MTFTETEAKMMARNVPAREWKNGESNRFEYVYNNNGNRKGPIITIGQHRDRSIGHYLVIQLDNTYSPHTFTGKPIEEIFTEVIKKRITAEEDDHINSLRRLGLSEDRIRELRHQYEIS